MEMGIREPYPRECAVSVLCYASGHRSRRLQTTPRPFSRGWRIHAGGTWVRMPSLSFTSRAVQCPQQERPGPGDRASARNGRRPSATGEVGWQVAPRTTRSQDGEESVKNGTQGVDRRSTTLGLGRQMALQILPLPFRKIARITCAHSSSLSCEVISAINKTRS